jgi:hypothetical protein
MLRMADNSDGDSDNQGDFGDDGDLMDKIRQLEKEKDKLSRKNTERARLEKQYRELSKSVKSLKGSSNLSVSSGYGFPLSSPLLNELVSVDLFPVKFFSLDLCSFNIVVNPLELDSAILFLYNYCKNEIPVVQTSCCLNHIDFVMFSVLPQVW